MAECACVWVGDFDEPEDATTVHRTAKMRCGCGECGRTVRVGEKYEFARLKYDGRWSSYVTCRDCESIRDSFFCDGWLFETLLDDLQEHINAMNGEIASECLEPLTLRAREMVCDMIEKAWAHLEDEDD